MTFSSRKRTRSSEDDVSDFLPISKRINNIHIRSNGTKLINSPEDKSFEVNHVNNHHLHNLHENLSNGSQQGESSNHFPNGVNPYQRLNYMENSNELQQASFSGHNVNHHLPNGHSSSNESFHLQQVTSASNSLPGSSNQHEWMGEGQQNSSIQCQAPLPFEPELSASQNPIYYQINEMLYQLHAERLRRMAK